jgi:hypothetical protein
MGGPYINTKAEAYEILKFHASALKDIKKII